MATGYVYILTNDCLAKDMLKIGKTTRSVEGRARELSSGTGVPSNFQVAYKVKVPNCDTAEKQIHEKLAAFRSNQNREFFKMPLAQAKSIVWNVAEALIRHHLRVQEWEFTREDGTAETKFEAAAREARFEIYKRLDNKDPNAWDPAAWEGEFVERDP